MPGNLKTRLKNGETLIGSLVTLAAPDVAEIMALAGFDYLWIEMEHAPAGFVQSQAMIQAAGGRCPCVIRIPAMDEVWIKKALDTGCDGIVVPQIRSAADAREAVRCCYYPPTGQRSVGMARAQQFGMGFQPYVETANERFALIVQVENASAVANVADIARVPGVDAVLIGPYDLSGSLGVLGQVDHPAVRQAISAVREACTAAGVPTGIFAGDVSAARAALAEGFSLMALSMDAVFLWQAARAALDAVRA